MKVLFALILALLLPVAAQAADPSADAVAAAKSWLALVDKGDYAKSWTEASNLLKTRISEAEWAKAAAPIHETLGNVVSREETGVDMRTSLPGAPDGQYAIVHFKTKFEKKDAANETVTMMLDGATWKSAGYFIN